MPYTIGQIATQLGVSKPYVKKMLVAHGLFDGHTTAEGGRGTIYVDDEATKAVSHYITQELAKRTARPDLDAILPDVEDDGSDASGSQQDGELVSAGRRVGHTVEDERLDIAKVEDWGKDIRKI